MQSFSASAAIQAERNDVTNSGSSGISERSDRRPEPGGPAEPSSRLGYPVAVAVWIGAGLLGWGLIAGLVLALR